MRGGAWLGIDVGDARVGVAYAPEGVDLAVPLETVPAHPRTKALTKLVKISEEKRVAQIMVGLPKHLSGVEGKSAGAVRLFAGRLAGMLPDVRVALIDERRTTVQAKGRLRERGIGERHQRPIVDQVAATVILEHALERERMGGPTGETVFAPGTEDGEDDE